MAVAFLCVTSVIVGLRLFQRLCLGSGLYPDDWLILVSYVSVSSNMPTSLADQCRSAAYQAR